VVDVWLRLEMVQTRKVIIINIGLIGIDSPGSLLRIRKSSSETQ